VTKTIERTNSRNVAHRHNQVQNVDKKQLKAKCSTLFHRHSSLIVVPQQTRRQSYIGTRMGYAYRLHGQHKPDANEKLTY